MSTFLPYKEHIAPEIMWTCTYTHPSTSTHPLYTLFSWTSLTWLTVDAADAVSVVHAVLVQVLVNAEPWKLFGFSYSFHLWCVWGIISISLEQVALWGQTLRLQWDTFSRLCCSLKNTRHGCRSALRRFPFNYRFSCRSVLRNNHEPNFALWQTHLSGN